MFANEKLLGRRSGKFSFLWSWLLTNHRFFFRKKNKAITFNVLEKTLGVVGEGFASPLNCTLSRFWSAFPSIDRKFGSSGSFFDAGEAFLEKGEHRLQFVLQTFCSAKWFKIGGAFELNPPFLEEHMLAMALALEVWLVQW